MKAFYTALLLSILWSVPAGATDRFFRDQKVTSPNGRYRVEAVSPDNGVFGSRRFQKDFHYEMHDLGAKMTLWERRQEKDEGSCAEIFVNNDGWTVICTSSDELIVISATGTMTGKVSLLEDGFTKAERKKYVRESTAGPTWEGYALWYFADPGGRPALVIRPWWGRRVIVDLALGKPVPEDETTAAACQASEEDFVRRELDRAPAAVPKWDDNTPAKEIAPVLKAVFLAGKLGLTETVPALREMEKSPLSLSSTQGGLSSQEKYQGEVNPHDYVTHTLRQVAQLSLRRLGEVPSPLPIFDFEVQFTDRDQNRPYRIPTLDGPRERFVRPLKAGLKAREVLEFVGSPDFIGYDTWEYDMDAKTPYTLVLTWDAHKVLKIRRNTPAAWEKGEARDRSVAE